MKKIIFGLGGLLFIGILSGCGGDDFNCESKEYAKEALNIILFDEREGSDDKNVTLETLGFEISGITLLKIDKDKKKAFVGQNFQTLISTQPLKKCNNYKIVKKKTSQKDLIKKQVKD
ncbi:hypothetical protein T36_0111 [Helicobacter cinaedi]|uniref:hypothetical protein n=1 Tax=Helicobacter cinaedi TaxID=213 RepID=UPI001F24A309|nr:hypothetical protein [Helicobacter cinaedi]BDB63676.1 hypothetical protein T36_0111 [Helicobacter cinaedi]